MAESTTTPLPRVRTYARDLEDERKKRGLPAPLHDRSLTPSATVAPKQKIPVPPPPKVSAAPITATPTVVPPTPKPITHIIATPALADSVSEAVLATRREEMKKAAEQLPATIPSFHDLMKRSSKSIPRDTRDLTPSDEARITITDDESGATIITDTKADRFKLAPSIFSSLKKWWTRRQAEQKARRAPKYVVPETDRRKGIIQQATSHSGKAITDDRAQLRDQVLRRGNTQKPREPDTVWTPNTENVFPLLEAPDGPAVSHVTNVQVTPKQRGDEPLRAPVTTPIAETKPPAPVVAVVTTPIVAVEAPAPEPLDPTPTEPEEVVDEVVADEDEPHSDTSLTMGREELRTRLAPQQRTPLRRLTTTNLQSAVVLFSIVIVSGAAYGLYTYLTTPGPAPAPVYEGIHLGAPTINTPLPTLERATLMQALNIAADARSVPAVALFFTNDTTVVPPASLLSLLNPAIDQSLAQNVRSAVFGWYNKDVPFMVLDITDRVSVWGGLLKEESVITSTLAPFFTFPTSLEAAFIDRKITSYDMRVLVDSAGNEYLAYSFINDHTVIVTKNHETLLLLATLAGEVK